MEVETKSTRWARRPAAAGEPETLNSVPTRVDVCSEAFSDAGSTPAASTIFIELFANLRDSISTLSSSSSAADLPAAAASSTTPRLGVSANASGFEGTVVTRWMCDLIVPGAEARLRAHCAKSLPTSNSERLYSASVLPRTATWPPNIASTPARETQSSPFDTLALRSVRAYAPTTTYGPATS